MAKIITKLIKILKVLVLSITVTAMSSPTNVFASDKMMMELRQITTL